jgi:hypothetical protein
MGKAMDKIRQEYAIPSTKAEPDDLALQLLPL